jgi:hypothetical protein
MGTYDKRGIMSQEINNREYRQKVIKDLISRLHAGKKSCRAWTMRFEALLKKFPQCMNRSIWICGS